MHRIPDFQNLLDVLYRRPTRRPVLFDFPIGAAHLKRLGGAGHNPDPLQNLRNLLAANQAAGYDFSWMPPMAGFTHFPGSDREHLESVGMAFGGVIGDWASFEAYHWPDPETDPWEIVDRFEPELPDGMKLIMLSSDGVLENLIKLVGYEPLCLLLCDDPDLVKAIADAIGSRLLRFYQRGLEHSAIGAVMVNDDWGFRNQLFLSPTQMRELVFPWHRRIVQAIHATGRPAILHSCGQLEMVWEEIIEDLQLNAKHSYEDTILPVEDAYEKYGSRIAILGGIDMDFLCRSTPEAVYRRSKAMLERTQNRGGYALGSGNSIPDYVPAANYDAMRRAAME